MRVKPLHSKFPEKFPAAQCAIALTICAFATISTVDGYAVRFKEQTAKPVALPRDLYRVEIDLDYRNASFSGLVTIRFTNATRDDLDFLSFYLYPNFGLAEADEPSLVMQRITAKGQDLYYSLRSRNALLRVELPQKLH